MIDFAYISIPKTASQSIRQLLIDNGRIDLARKNHESIYNYGEVGFSFSFVREPIERLKSWFYFSKKKMLDSYHPTNLQTFSSLSMYNCSFNDWVKNNFPIHWGKEMCLSLGITNPLIQSDFVCKNGIIDIDYLGNFNNLRNEMIEISKKMNFTNCNLKSIGSNQKPQENLDNETVSIIKQKFYNDFKLYEALLQNKHLTKGTKIF